MVDRQLSEMQLLEVEAAISDAEEKWPDFVFEYKSMRLSETAPVEMEWVLVLRVRAPNGDQRAHCVGQKDLLDLISGPGKYVEIVLGMTVAGYRSLLDRSMDMLCHGECDE